MMGAGVLRQTSGALDQVAQPASGRRQRGVGQVAGLERVLEADVGLGIQAESLAIGQTHNRAETQPRLPNDRDNRFGHDKPQVGCACSGHCGVSPEVLSCPDR